MLVALIDSQVVGAITPQVAQGLLTTPTLVAGSVMIYAVAAATVALLLGRYARRIEAATWLPRAAVLFVVADLLAACAPRLAVFWLARALAGFAGGLVSALAIAALANASAYAQRGRQMSGVAISYFLAPVLGVPVGTWLAGRFGWRVVFGAAAGLVGLAGLLVRQFPLRAVTTEHTDDTADATSDRATPNAAPVRAGASLAALWQLAWRTGATRRGIISAFFISGGLVGLTTYLGTWLFDAFHEGPREVGAIYAVAGLGAVVGGAGGGLLADRYGKRRIAVGSSIAMCMLLLLLPTFNRSAALWTLIGLTAFVAALRVAPLQALITELVAPAERATYVALRNGMSQLGIAVAVAVGARLYPRYGLMGVAAWCAVLTFGAWLSLRKLHDPHPPVTTDVGMVEQTPRSGWRVLRKLAYLVCALVLLIVVGLPLLLSFAVTKAGTRPDERRRTDTPAAAGASFEDVTFGSVDGNQLSGWYLPARTHAVNIVLTHGLFRSRYEMLARGLELWRAGYGVLLYDLRRHGASSAEFSTIGYDERHDVEAALAFVRHRAPGQRLVLMGVSMGAAATLLAAAEQPNEQDIIGIIAESSFLSFADTVRHHVSLIHSLPAEGSNPRFSVPAFPFATLLIKFTAWRMNFRPDDFDVLRAVRKVERPILFIGGTADQRMPNETVLEPLYAAAPNPRKRKLVVTGATHGHAYDTDPVGYMNAVRDFLQMAEAAAGAQ